MARLSAEEFDRLIGTLVAHLGLGKLQENLVRSHAIVSRRRIGSPEALSRQLYQLTLGLERDGLVTQVVLALWEGFLREKVDEETANRLEALAEKINAALGPGMTVDPSREPELRIALSDYRGALCEKVGEHAAQLTMLTRAVPGVARLLREPT